MNDADTRMPCACGSMLHRRGLLTGLGAIGLATAARAAPPTEGIIDVHHHLLPPAYVAARRSELEAVGFTPQTLTWTPQATLDHLDRTGARAAILSLSAPGCWFGDDAEACRLARTTNDYGAQMVRDHPTRLGLFAAMPWPDVEGTLKEIAYAYDVLKVDGVGFITSYGGAYPGSPKYMPIWQELNRRKAVVYFHPTTPTCCAAMVPGVTPATIEFPFDTTRAIASLMVGLVFSKCPDVRFIFSHGGGTLPMLAQRMAGLAGADRANAAQMRGGPMGELKRLNFDTASVANPSAWAGLRGFAPAEQILFGTDYPFGSIAAIGEQLSTLGIGEADMALIGHGNAERLLPRFAR